MFKYKLPRLVDHDGDVSKEWYVIYYIWNRDKNILERKRITAISKFPTGSERRQAAKIAIKEITELLQSGGTSFVERPKNKAAGLDPNKATLFQAFEYALEIKKGSLKSLKGFNSLKTHLKEWITSHRYEHLLLKGIDPITIHKFFDYLIKKPVGNKTYNNLKGYLSTIFNFYVSRGWIDKNPVEKVVKLKTQSGKHTPFSKAQVKAIKKELDKSEEKQLALFIQCIYYTFIRPGELRRLKIDNIKEKTIFVPANISKNGKGEHVIIPKPLMELLKPLRKYPANYYLFTIKGEPGEIMVGENFFYKRHVKLLKSIGLDYDDYTLYGYKHTGNIALFNAGADIKTLQKQNRHSSIQQTDTYLKDLGLIRNEELKLFPVF